MCKLSALSKSRIFHHSKYFGKGILDLEENNSEEIGVGVRVRGGRVRVKNEKFESTPPLKQLLTLQKRISAIYKFRN